MACSNTFPWPFFVTDFRCEKAAICYKSQGPGNIGFPVIKRHVTETLGFVAYGIFSEKNRAKTLDPLIIHDPVICQFYQCVAHVDVFVYDIMATKCYACYSPVKISCPVQAIHVAETVGFVTYDTCFDSGWGE